MLFILFDVRLVDILLKRWKGENMYKEMANLCPIF